MIRFTIRDVLWLTVVVALGLSVWRYHEWKLEEQRDFYWQALRNKQRESAASSERAKDFRKNKDEDHEKLVWHQYQRILELERKLKALPDPGASPPPATLIEP
jgi:hypothetical protein